MKKSALHLTSCDTAVKCDETRCIQQRPNLMIKELRGILAVAVVTFMLVRERAKERERELTKQRF